MNYAVAGLRPADKQCFDSATRRKTQTSESSHTETFSLSEYKNRGTRPRFLWFCKAKPISSSHAAGMTVAHTPCALFPPNLAFGKEGGQACRSRPRKIPRKSPALPDFYTSASGHVSRAAPAVQGRGGYHPRFLRNRGCIQGGQRPPWRKLSATTASCHYPAPRRTPRGTARADPAHPACRASRPTGRARSFRARA